MWWPRVAATLAPLSVVPAILPSKQRSALKCWTEKQRSPDHIVRNMGTLTSLCDKYTKSNRIGHFREVFEKVQPRIQHAKEDYHSDFLVMVVGAFSAGKSTLINSLVKQKVCSVGIQPTTDAINFIPFPQVKGVKIIDSPGLDALGEERHNEKALAAAQRANMAILVLNARQPIRESERPLIKELLLSKSDVVVALNYWNTLDDERERREAMEFVEKAISELFPQRQVLILPMNAKDLNDKGVNGIRDRITQLRSSGSIASQKQASAQAAIARDAAELLRALENHGQVLLDTHNSKMRTFAEKKREAMKDFQHSKQLQRAGDSARQAQVQSAAQRVQNLEDRLETERLAPGGFWRGAAMGSTIDVATRGWTMGAGALVGGIANAICSSADNAAKCAQIQCQLHRAETRLQELQRQQEPFDSLGNHAVDRIEQTIEAEKSEFHTIKQDLEEDIRRLTSMIEATVEPLVMSQRV